MAAIPAEQYLIDNSGEVFFFLVGGGVGEMIEKTIY